MQAIKVNYYRPELKSQLDYLIKLEFKITYGKYLKPLYYLISFSALFALLLLFTDSSFLTSFKAVFTILIAINWAVVCIMIVAIAYKIYRRNKWRNETIEYFSKNDTSAYISFDDEIFTAKTNHYNTEIKWSYFSYYAINKDCIFIIPSDNIYSSLYYSMNEIGIENFELLKKIVMDKLQLLIIK